MIIIGPCDRECQVLVKERVYFFLGVIGMRDDILMQFMSEVSPAVILLSENTKLINCNRIMLRDGGKLAILLW